MVLQQRGRVYPDGGGAGDDRQAADRPAQQAAHRQDAAAARSPLAGRPVHAAHDLDRHRRTVRAVRPDRFSEDQ